MKGLLMASALMVLAATGADAQRAGSGPRNVITSGGGQAGDARVGTGQAGRGDGRGDGRKLVGDVWIIENEVVEVVEVPVEKAAEAAPAAPAKEEEPKPREPYVVGNSYSSLPGSCMKLLQDGASYYLCGGDWYQSVGGGQYKAVRQP